MREIIKIFQDMMRKITEAGWKKADAESVKEEDIRYVGLCLVQRRGRPSSSKKKLFLFVL